MTNIGPSSLRQLVAAAAGQNAHQTSLAFAMGDRLQVADCYRNMYMQWHVALSEATQGPLDLTLLMQVVSAEICSTPLAAGELLLGKDGALLEATGDGKRLNLATREICVASEDEFPIGRVHELYRRTVEKLQPHFDAHFDPTENRLITTQHLSMLQQRALKQYENEALETIWNGRLAIQLNLQNNPNLQTHEQIRAWLNDLNNAQQLQQITTLELNGLNLKALPPEICALTNLQTLNLYNNQLRSLPAEISSLTNLLTLNLNYNLLRSLPPKIGALGNLLTLELDNNQLRSLPAEIGSLGNLQKLYLNKNQLCSLPPEIGALGNLQELLISINRLRSLPTEIGSLGNLRRLDLDNNQLRSLPPEIGTLSSLLKLNLRNNQLRSLPPEIGTLANLQKLFLANNQLSSLPSEIGTLSNLRLLGLSDNQLSSLPSEIGTLSNLGELYLSNNQLVSLPPEIGALSNLGVLGLSDNQLSSLPSEIGALSNLQELFIFNNQLVSLPLELEIDALSELRRLDYDDNPWIFISDQKLAKDQNIHTAFGLEQKIATFFRLNKEFAEYPTQSSLGHLFQLIARHEDVATIQNTFEELDEKLQSRIKELANSKVLAPVTSSSNWTPSTDGNLFSNMPRLSFEELDSELQSKIIELANSRVLTPVAASSNWTPSTDENLFSDISRLSRAVKEATMEKFENLSQTQKNRVYGKIWELAGRPKTHDPKWGEHHAFDNMLRFVDALEAVTKK